MPEWMLHRVEFPEDGLMDQMGETLWRATEDLPRSYTTRADTLEEARRFRSDGWFAIIASIDENVIGWVGAIMHTSYMWELHPLCVDPRFHGKRLGTALVNALEAEASRAHVCAIWLGTEDEVGATNLFGVDLYPDPLEALGRLELLDRHPIAFYKKLGYVLCGALPDASGAGMHDFLMSKRISPAARGATDGD